MTKPIPSFVLQRLTQDDYATFGQLVDGDGVRLMVTLELPWRDNHPQTSCVPAGIYSAHRRLSPKHKCELFQLDNVPGREACQVHIANWPDQLLGCIAVGVSAGSPEGKRGVIASRAAFEGLMK